ncbi:MAG: prepilin-type N-terminal cleavage/methylation domain-containing protein [Planctomycetota bacterium]
MRKTLNGFTLVECVIALILLMIGLAATLMCHMANIRSDQFTEERRLALQAAVEQIDKIRSLVASGQSLDTIYNRYCAFAGETKIVNNVLYAATDSDNLRPLPAFKVTGLTERSSDPLRRAYVGTISLIIDEMPNEQDYGVDYSVTPSVLNLGADINGNGYYRDAYPASPPSPFPLDINGDGTTIDNPMISGFYILPIVVTVHWTGVLRPQQQRIDLFTIIFPDKRF